MTVYTITRATANEARIIADFNQKMALETEDKHLPDDRIYPGVEALLGDESMGYYLVAKEAEKVVGCLAITYEWSDWRNGLFWWIQSVYVPAEYRGQGVFSQMYEHVKQAAQNEDNVCGIRLYVERDNDRAYGTYRRLGMIETDYRLMEEEF